MPAFFYNEQATDSAQFTALATDPSYSVAIEACAGSGKTTLLVARITKILLSGVKPDEILAISFTRKAAAEILERVQQMLQYLAQESDDKVIARLAAMQIDHPERQLEAARQLYPLAFGQGCGLSITTFHGWFVSLLKQLPLSSGVTPAFNLLENDAHFRDIVWHRWINLRLPAQMQDLRTLYMALGDRQTHHLLNAFIAYRAEWRLATYHDSPEVYSDHDADSTELTPYQWLKDLFGTDGQRDPRYDFFTPEHCAQLQTLASTLGQGSDAQQNKARAIEAVLSTIPVDDESALTRFDAIKSIFLTQKNEPSKPLKVKISFDEFAASWESMGVMIADFLHRSEDTLLLSLHAPLMRLGHHLVNFYQSEKNDARVLDFADLEFEMLRLMCEEEYAAYFQARLETRCRHILIDEFQDTNPLQWHVLYAWLQGYVEVGEAIPTLFLVGDPKQSIYRFRRADPRVFDTAQQWLRTHIANSIFLRTDHTWRNAPAITSTLNQLFAHNPRYHPHSSGATDDNMAAVTVLPLIQAAPKEVRDTTEVTVLRNPLHYPAVEHEQHLREIEGQQICAMLIAAQKTHHFAWNEVLLLMRTRSHLADYEEAFRAAGIPFSSDRKNSWQESLEVSDFLALARFVLFQDDHALAHVLSSPMFDWPNERLSALAYFVKTQKQTLNTGERATLSWFSTLPEFLQQCDESADSITLIQQHWQLLLDWIDAARRLSIHDFFDSVFARADVPACYWRNTPSHEHAQIERNLYALLHASLSFNAGRYPRLADFVAQFGTLSDDALPASHDDGVQFMTIHGAKGKEAQVVVLLNSNTSNSFDKLDLLIDWPLEQAHPTHISAFWNKDVRGVARNALFAQEQHYAQQEEWNLFYVACTRAKKLLIFSAVANGKKSSSKGLDEDSWYGQISSVISSAISSVIRPPETPVSD